MQITAPLRQGHLLLVHTSIVPRETGFHLSSLRPCFEKTQRESLCSSKDKPGSLSLPLLLEFFTA